MYMPKEVKIYHLLICNFDSIYFTLYIKGWVKKIMIEINMYKIVLSITHENISNCYD